MAKFLDLRKGIPSHDTFGRVFARINPEQFRLGFLSWVQAVFEISSKQVIAIDGKQLRRSKKLGKGAIHMVSAWATANSLVLGQFKVRTKSNEITAIPLLLALLDLKGCIVTIDAMGCQTAIAKQIVEQGGDYLLSVKKNQGQLYDDLQLFFKLCHQNEFTKVNVDYHKTTNGGHGRIETRECWAISGEDALAFLRTYPAWENLTTIVSIRSHRYVGKKKSIEDSFFISSLPNVASHLLQTKRAHWGIENQLHWVLDVAFREDDCRVRQGNGAENYAVLRHMALNLLKQEQSTKMSLRTKRLKAAWNTNYLLKVLSV